MRIEQTNRLGTPAWLHWRILDDTLSHIHDGAPHCGSQTNHAWSKRLGEARDRR